MKFTRRETSGLLLAGAASMGAWPTAASDGLARQLQAALDRIGRDDAALILKSLDTSQGRLVATIELTWPPGLRRRQVAAQAHDIDAVGTMIADARSVFADAVGDHAV